MNRRELLIAGVLFLCLVEVGLTHILMNFNDKQHRGAGRTLTRELLLGLRQAAPKLDLNTRLHIASLGCGGRRRGCCAGRQKAKHRQQAEIPVVVGRRRAVLRTTVAEVR